MAYYNIKNFKQLKPLIKMIYILIALMLVSFLIIIKSFMSKSNPPIADKILHEYNCNNIIIKDEYHWMRDKSWPQVSNKKILKYLEEENKYCEQFFSNKKDLINSIVDKIASKTVMSGKSITKRKGEYFYFSRKEEHLNYPIYYRQHINSNQQEEVILDINEIAKNKSYCHISDISVCPNNRYLAYCMDDVGMETYCLHIIDLKTHTHIDKVENATCIVWHETILGLFYVSKDDKLRNKKVFFHQLQSDKTDQLIYDEEREIFSISIYKSSDKKFVFVDSGDHRSNEVKYIQINKENHFKPQLILTNKQDIKYSADSFNENNLLIEINDVGPNYRLVLLNILDESKNLKEYVKYDENRPITGFSLTKNYLLINYIKDGIPEMEVHNIKSKKVQKINIPSDDQVFESSVFCNHYEDDQIYLHFSSPSSKSKYFQYNFNQNKTEIVLDENLSCNINSSKYQVKRIFANNNGVKIPITLFMQKDQDLKNPNKLFLYGYGSYGIRDYLGHSAFANVLVDEGFIYATAHIRGGGHLGDKWHEGAKLMCKKNTFEDFIACSKYLIENKYTHSDKMIICGGSAGGMLIGNVINQAPELYKAAIANVPFVDVLNTMLDSSLPLTAGEWEEWGNPIKNSEYTKYIHSYCPYSNVKSQKYPNIFAIASLADQRVGYWEAAKWIAKIRKNNLSSNKIILSTNMTSGHLGCSSRKEKFAEAAKEIVFALSMFDEYAK